MSAQGIQRIESIFRLGPFLHEEAEPCTQIIDATNVPIPALRWRIDFGRLFARCVSVEWPPSWAFFSHEEGAAHGYIVTPDPHDESHWFVVAERDVYLGPTDSEKKG